MAEVTYSWPARDASRLVGARVPRIDGMAKSTGAAKYTYDVQLPNQLIAVGLGCPHAHCRIRAIDIRPAQALPGVVHVHVLKQPTTSAEGETTYPEIRAQGDLIAVVAAESEGAAREGVAAIVVEYEQLPVFVTDNDLEAAEAAGLVRQVGGRVDLEAEPGENDDEEEFEQREIARLFESSAHVVEGFYGIDAITHCCLEPHGTTLAWQGGKLDAYLSTQNVSGTDDGFADALGVAASDVTVHCEYIGGGFGSKFQPGYWAIAAAEIARATGRPVQFLLQRDQELKIGGNRPSGYIRVKLGADADGVVQVWDSVLWGSSGYNGGTVSVNTVPYVFRPKNNRSIARGVTTNNEPSVAWRAPNHPQACALTQTAYDDLAAKMKADSLVIFQRNLQNIASRQRAEVYSDQLKIAADLIGWRQLWHPHGEGTRNGSVVEGVGIGLHEWGGGANSSTCQLKIHPDGSVETRCGTQDLGTGTRTACAVVVAETLGLPVEAIKVQIGHSTYPFSGASGGSTTIGAVAESHRRASLQAVAKIFDLVAAKLGVDANSLVARDQRIVVADKPDQGVSWKEACALIGIRPLEVSVSHQQGTRSPLSNDGVGGVQMAHVAVDTETGVVRMKKLVAVQDMGLVVSRLQAESQIYGAVIMEIAYSLFEQRISDPKTGEFLNCQLSDYRLPRLGDIGEIVVHVYETDEQRARGVIGLGEPPVISGGAAISNAVCNALGVRVPVLPITPDRVLEALRRRA